jgi:hypothetical protein
MRYLLVALVGSLLCLGLADTIVYAEPDSPPPPLYEQYRGLQQMQLSLLRRSPEEQARLQPQVQRAELAACRQLRREKRERVSIDSYRNQGGDEFVAFVLQFELYCQTLE